MSVALIKIHYKSGKVNSLPLANLLRKNLNKNTCMAKKNLVELKH